ncbi:hypothetical protein [Marisediminicola sp. LYQ134]|uniref:hypothetical protein n=1 Tax=Marisediminicola sp. LYQ134 TaxID=3391061 RepID=UPI0039836B8E
MPPRRDAQRTDRWRVFKGQAALGWAVGPIGDSVFADLRTGRRWIFFTDWQEAIDYVMRRVYGK